MSEILDLINLLIESKGSDSKVVLDLQRALTSHKGTIKLGEDTILKLVELAISLRGSSRLDCFIVVSNILGKLSRAKRELPKYYKCFSLLAEKYGDKFFEIEEYIPSNWWLRPIFGYARARFAGGEELLLYISKYYRDSSKQDELASIVVSIGDVIFIERVLSALLNIGKLKNVCEVVFSVVERLICEARKRNLKLPYDLLVAVYNMDSISSYLREAIARYLLLEETDRFTSENPDLARRAVFQIGVDEIAEVIDNIQNIKVLNSISFAVLRESFKYTLLNDQEVLVCDSLYAHVDLIKKLPVEPKLARNYLEYLAEYPVLYEYMGFFVDLYEQEIFTDLYMSAILVRKIAHDKTLLKETLKELRKLRRKCIQNCIKHGIRLDKYQTPARYVRSLILWATCNETLGILREFIEKMPRKRLERLIDSIYPAFSYVSETFEVTEEDLETYCNSLRALFEQANIPSELKKKALKELESLQEEYSDSYAE